MNIDDFEMLKVTAKGSFGKVLKVRKKDDGKIYSLRVLGRRIICEQLESFASSQTKILLELIHPFLVKTNFSFRKDTQLFLVCDYVKGDDLFFHLQRDKKFAEERVRFYCAQVVLGLEYLHDSGVLFGELKAENILLTRDGYICMADFGISIKQTTLDPNSSSDYFHLAPEILEGKDADQATDWWSFGILMFEMFTGLPPFYSHNVREIFPNISQARLIIPDSISLEATDLLVKLLERNPDKRLADPTTIKVHPWFSTIEWDKLFHKEVLPLFIPRAKRETERVNNASIEMENFRDFQFVGSGLT